MKMMKKNKTLALMILLCAAVMAAAFLRPFSLPVFAETGSSETASQENGSEPEAASSDAAAEPAATGEDASESGFTGKLAMKFKSLFKEGTGGEIIAFLASLLPIIECRGGMIIAKIFRIPFWKAFFICYVGNIIPVPFILLFIRKIFEFMKKHNILKGLIEKLEGKGAKNRDKVMRYKQWGLLLFVAVPLPGTGGWTGSLIAAMLDIDFKKSLPIIAIGVLIADVIMSILVYGTGAAFGF